MSEKFKFPPLDIKSPITQRDGTPSPPFQLQWQKVGRAIEGQEARQDELIAMIQETQEDLEQTQEELAAQVAYLNSLSNWLVDLGRFNSEWIAYLAEAVAEIAMQGNYTIPDPGGLPNYPGPPPTPPPPPEPEPEP